MNAENRPYGKLDAIVSPSLDPEYRYQVTLYDKNHKPAMGSWSDTIEDARAWAKYQGASEVRVVGGSVIAQKDHVDHVEVLSARFHDIYQVEAHHRSDVRHADRYEDLSEGTKEWDRVLARWVLTHFRPAFDWADGVPGPDDSIAQKDH